MESRKNENSNISLLCSIIFSSHILVVSVCVRSEFKKMAFEFEIHSALFVHFYYFSFFDGDSSFSSSPTHVRARYLSYIKIIVFVNSQSARKSCNVIFGFHIFAFSFSIPSSVILRGVVLLFLLLLLLPLTLAAKTRCMRHGVHVYCLRDEAIRNFWWLPVILIFWQNIPCIQLC